MTVNVTVCLPIKVIKSLDFQERRTLSVLPPRCKTTKETVLLFIERSSYRALDHPRGPTKHPPTQYSSCSLTRARSPSNVRPPSHYQTWYGYFLRCSRSRGNIHCRRTFPPILLYTRVLLAIRGGWVGNVICRRSPGRFEGSRSLDPRRAASRRDTRLDFGLQVHATGSLTGAAL